MPNISTSSAGFPRTLTENYLNNLKLIDQTELTNRLVTLATTVNQNISNLSTNTSAAISTEKTRATTAENTISENIIVNANKIITENTRAVASETVLTNNLTTQTNNLNATNIIVSQNTSNASSNANLITNLQTRATTDESLISANKTSINNFATKLDTAEVNSIGISLGLGSKDNTEFVNLANGSGIMTVNIASNPSPGACTINIGNSGDTINLAGTLINVNTTNADVSNTVLTLNKGGAIGSSGLSGIYMEEAGDNTQSYFRSASNRLGIELKAVLGPSMLINQSLGKTDSVIFSNVSSNNITAIQSTLNSATSAVTSSTLVKRDLNGSVSLQKLYVGQLQVQGDVLPSNGDLLAYDSTVPRVTYLKQQFINLAGDVTGTLSSAKITSIGQSVNIYGGITSTGLVKAEYGNIVNQLTVGSIITNSILVGGPITATNVSCTSGLSAININATSISCTANLIGGNIYASNSLNAPNLTLTGKIFINSTTPIFDVSSNRNTFIGQQSASVSGGGGSNTTLGMQSLQSLTTATSNTAIGASCLQSITTGSYNTAIGDNAMNGTIDGLGCIAIGQNVGRKMRQGTDNLFIGNNSDQSNSTINLTRAIAFGADAIVSESNVIQMGYYGITKMITAGAMICNSIISNSNNVSFQIGVGMGTNAVNYSRGNSICGELSFTTGSAPAANEFILTGVFASVNGYDPFLNKVPSVVITPRAAFTASMPIASMICIRGNGNTFALFSNTTALDANTFYTWQYMVSAF